MTRNNMIKYFIIWITIQLMILGWFTVEIHNDVVNKIHDCSIDILIPRTIGALFPLILFMNDLDSVKEYCDDK